ncbi:MAG: hypothetical protein A2161_11575 [Candidatus Schekmanbacteria bacterium RBG_13_48_7]|uniref:DUF2283 domain-containing protein n=1 Tax=Candidatus Schekmanbacteria bacterium RBG_13_48_7 TaxID=1817878 RepID=A0A1F7RWC2_9BACT|nr:MAG: hypothetical protein A2161_11575 [Candidatus Schekmanbacteria bacterium RBG_13_48_7]
MKIKYFSDTDTALIEFFSRKTSETKEINENIYIDLDASGNLVALRIEHARQQANLPFLSYEQVEEEKPKKSHQRARLKIHR